MTYGQTEAGKLLPLSTSNWENSHNNGRVDMSCNVMCYGDVLLCAKQSASYHDLISG